MTLFQFDNLNLNLLKYKVQALVVSATMVALSCFSLFSIGLNLAVDFTGGTIIDLTYEETPSLNDIRNTLKQNGFNKFTVQNFGSARNILIRIQNNNQQADLSDSIVQIIKKEKEVVVNRIEFVGPQVGKDLTEQGFLAVLLSVIGILIYVSLRFEIRFALSAVLALVHDVVITLGIISVTQVEFNLTVVAAILAIIGYSLNDSIVILDRVRENLKLAKEQEDVFSIINSALLQTLSRTIITSTTTLLVVTSLLILGGETIYGFSLALLVGVIVGTYSSIYIASLIAIYLGVSPKNLEFVKNQNKNKTDFEEEIKKEFLNKEHYKHDKVIQQHEDSVKTPEANNAIRNRAKRRKNNNKKNRNIKRKN